MNKEKIREGMRQVIKNHLLAGAISTEVEEALAQFLDQENVRIVKEIKLPRNRYKMKYDPGEHYGYRESQQDMLKAFNESLERLI